MTFGEKIQEFLKGIAGKDQRRIMNYILILALLGIFLVVWSNIQSSTTPRPMEPSVEETVVEDLETALAESLSRMAGVGEVRVHIYYSTGSLYRFGEDRYFMEKASLEEDPEGRTKQTREESQDYRVVVLRDGAGGERALVEEEIKPQISGVLIVAHGADQAVIRDRLIRSVATLFSLPLHRIEAVSGKGGS